MLFQPLKPMLLTRRAEAFDDDQYIFEPKWDGFRILLHKQGDRIEAYTRHGNRVTHRFPELSCARTAIEADTAVLDCEGVCMRDGRSIFDDFQYRGRLTSEQKIKAAMKTHPATFVVFDLLMSDDQDHRNEPLIDRKYRLAEIVQSCNAIAPTMFVDSVGKQLKQHTEDRGWEGIVAKRKASRYTLDVRSTEWLKIKNWRTIDTVILGYRTEPHFALVVGLNFPTIPLKPVAVLEYGFTSEEKHAFKRVVSEIHTVKSKNVQWVEPRLCCRIRFLDRTENYNLRMATFERFVFDKSPDDCEWVS